MKKFVAGLVQQRCTEDGIANIEASAAGIRKAAAAGAALVVLQELHLGPYFCQVEDPANFDRAQSIPGPATEALGALARELGVVIVASIFERRTAGIYHNTAVVLDADGSMAGRYRKMHIPDDPGYYEKYYFTPGDLGFHPVAASLGRLGVLVCWDQWYPEAARLMALAGGRPPGLPHRHRVGPQGTRGRRRKDARRLGDHPEVPRRCQRVAGPLRQPGGLRALAGTPRGRDTLLGKQLHCGTERRNPCPGRLRRGGGPHGGTRPRQERARPPRLAFPARPPHRFLPGPPGPIPGLAGRSHTGPLPEGLKKIV